MADVAASSVVSTGAIAELQIGAPVLGSEKVLCVGLNYSEHVGETDCDFPTHPDIFSKFASSLIGPFDPIDCAEVSPNLDLEGELAVIIGRSCRRVSEAEAMAHVAGLTVLNDTRARDLQKRGTQWLPGKAVDHSTPCGPRHW